MKKDITYLILCGFLVMLLSVSCSQSQPIPIPSDRAEGTIKSEDEFGEVKKESINALEESGFEVIEDKSFEIELDSFGAVRFVSGCKKEKEIPRLQFYLVDENEDIKYVFPDFYGNKWVLYQLKDVAFEDVNGDGLKDVVILSEYILGHGENAAQPFKVAGVYIQSNDKFVSMENLNDKINENEKNDTIHEVLEFLKTQENNEAFLPIILPRNTTSILLGGIQGDKWISADLYEQLSGITEADKRELFKQIQPGGKYSFYSIDEKIGSFEGESVVEENGPGEWYSISYSPELKESVEVIGICADWNALPRIPKVKTKDFDEYESIVADALTAKGLKSKAIIKQVVSVDLDGNGSEESIITATNVDFSENTYAQTGDYSFILLLAGNEVIVLAENYYLEPNPNVPTTYNTVSFVVDADGDGKMEIVTQSEYYEGVYIDFYKMNDKKIVHVLNFGLGA